MTVNRPLSAPRPLKLTLEDFLLLDEAGAFNGYRKVELIEGVLYTMNPQQTRHAVAKTDLAFRLYTALKALGSEFLPVVEGTVAMPPKSAPEPDIAVGQVVRGEKAYMPLSAVSFVVELSDSTLRYDLGKKKRLYARHLVPEYWVVDPEAGRIHQFWGANRDGYRQSRVHSLGEPIESVVVTGLMVETDGLV